MDWKTDQDPACILEWLQWMSLLGYSGATLQMAVTLLFGGCRAMLHVVAVPPLQDHAANRGHFRIHRWIWHAAEEGWSGPHVQCGHKVARARTSYGMQGHPACPSCCLWVNSKTHRQHQWPDDRPPQIGSNPGLCLWQPFFEPFFIGKWLFNTNTLHLYVQLLTNFPWDRLFSPDWNF